MPLFMLFKKKQNSNVSAGMALERSEVRTSARALNLNSKKYVKCLIKTMFFKRYIS